MDLIRSYLKRMNTNIVRIFQLQGRVFSVSGIARIILFHDEIKLLSKLHELE
jgi:hypothetical protein